MTEAGASVDACVRGGAARLRRAGIPEPEREAWRIWADLRGELPGRSLLDRERPTDDAEAARFEEAVGRRAQGEPLAYVTGIAGFRRLTLKSDRRALIPRPETEGLVDLILERQAAGVAADVGTGTGCLALALADEGGYRQVVAIDRSRDALELARENRALTCLPIQLVRGDLASALAAGSCDAVVSNPPYLTVAEHAALEPGVREHEPAMALASGEDGLEATTRLLGDAGRVLRARGWLGLEVDTERAEQVARLAGELRFTDITVHKDLFDRARYVIARRSEAE